MQKDFKKTFLIIILAAVFMLGFFAFSVQAQAATYYIDEVSDGGSDSNDGSISSPWVTFNYSISRMSAGDILIAKAGTYSQSFSVTKSGITIQGTLDANGNRLSVIDPYINVSGGWTHTGNGVYRKNIGWKTWALAVEIEGIKYKIPRLCQVEDNPYLQRYIDYCGDWQTDLARTSAITHTWVTDGRTNGPINFWDGFNALFSSSSDGYVYVSFGNDADVNGLTVYAAPQDSSTITVSASNVAIKNMEIRAINFGIYVDGSNITIDNNKINLGRRKIRVNSGGDNLVITNNIITDQNYADAYIGEYERGSWAKAAINTPYLSIVRRHQYSQTKFGLTADAPGEESGGIEIQEGDGAVISDNEISYVNQGLNFFYPTDYEISSNYVHNSESICYAQGIGGGINSSIHDNVFGNCNSILRFMCWNGGCSGPPYNNYVDIDIYRNKFWQPTGMGAHLLFHYYSAGSGSISNVGDAQIYHNSFSGGLNVVQIQGSAAHYSPKGMENVKLINNIMSGEMVVYDESGASLGSCINNWFSNTSVNFCTSGTNIFNTTLMWDTTELHDFNMTDSRAINAGIDISQPFMINGTTYPALPGFNPKYFTGIKPDMGAVQSGHDTDTTPPAPPSGVSVQ